MALTRRRKNLWNTSAASRRAVSAILVASGIAGTARAADDIYTNASGGFWSTAGNWNRGVVPPIGDRAFLNGIGNYVVTLDTSYTSTGLSTLVVDGGGPANSTTLSQTGPTNMIAGLEWIGDGGSGNATYLQSAGTNTDSGDFYIAHTLTTTVGQYKLLGGALTVAGSEFVGFLGTGTFTQTGGTNTINGPQLSIGNSTPGSGLYTINGSTTVTNNGQTNVNAGGTLNIGTNPLNFPNFSANGNTTVDGGAINIENGAQFGFSNKNLTVKNGGAFAYTSFAAQLSQGVTTIQSGGQLALSVSSPGVLINDLLGPAGANTAVLVDGVGSGITVYSGGAFATYELDFAAGSGATASFTTQNGAFASVGRMVFGTSGSSTATLLVQSGGTMTSDDLTFAGNAASGSVGTGSVTGANSILTVRNAGTITVGGTSGSTGNLNVLSGGTLNAGTGGMIINNTGKLTINGGTANLTGITVNGAGFISLLAGTLKAPSLFTNVLGASPIIGPSQTVNITGTTTITNSLTVSNGVLVTSDLVNNGIFTFNSGVVQITGNQGLTIGAGSPLGNSVTINAFSNLLISHTTTINSGASLTSQGVFQSGPLINNGTLSTSGTSFDTQNLTNNGSATLSMGAVTGVLLNNGTLGFVAGRTIPTFGVLNENVLTFDNASLSGSAVTNDFSGTFTGRGTLGVPLINNGAVALTGTLAVTNLTNGGFITANAGQNLQVSGASSNTGTIQLNGGGMGGAGAITNSTGLIQGGGGVTAPLNNAGGIVFANSATLPLTISNLTANGGQLKATDGSTLIVTSPFTNSGIVNPKGPNAIVAGGAITNTGTIKGAGTVSNVVANSGTVRAEGGELDLGATGNSNSGQIQAASGNTVMYVQGLAANAGTIALTGGAFDNNNIALSNTGTISGNGIVRTGGLTNASGGLLLLTDVNSSVFGPVNNSSGGNIKIVSNTTSFFGSVTNNGTIKTTSGIARFLGNGVSMTVGGTYNSDPSDNYFNGLSVTSSGTVLGGNGDRFFLTGGTTLTNAGAWNVTGTLSSNAVTNSGTFTQTGALTETANFTNSGNATIGGTQNWSAGTTFSNTAGASATFRTDVGSNVSTPLAINASGGSVTFGSSQHLSSMTLSGGATAFLTAGGTKLLRAQTLSISAGSRLDLADNELVTHSDIGGWNAGAYTGITGLVASGRNGGSGLVTSQTQASGASSLTTLAVAANSDLGKTTFGGESVGNSDVLVMYTYAGDADLTGNINGDDYFRIDSGYSSRTTGYANGDFNYDGVINADDYFLIDRDYSEQRAPFGSAAPPGGVSTVPEPISAGLLALAAMAIPQRRRRRKTI